MALQIQKTDFWKQKTYNRSLLMKGNTGYTDFTTEYHETIIS